MDFTVICWIPRPLVVARRDTSAPQVGWPTNRWCLSPAARKRIHTIILNICGYTCICIYIYIYIYGHVFAHNFYVTYISYIIRIVYIYIYTVYAYCIHMGYGQNSWFTEWSLAKFVSPLLCCMILCNPTFWMITRRLHTWTQMLKGPHNCCMICILRMPCKIPVQTPWS